MIWSTYSRVEVTLNLKIIRKLFLAPSDYSKLKINNKECIVAWEWIVREFLPKYRRESIKHKYY